MQQGAVASISNGGKDVAGVRLLLSDGTACPVRRLNVLTDPWDGDTF
jgi:hypothetical protein